MVSDISIPLLLAVAVGLLVAVIVGAVVLSLLFNFFSRFLRKNVPDDKALDTFDAGQSAGIQKRLQSSGQPVRMSPHAEPFLIAAIGFILVYILAALFVRVPPSSTAATASSSPSSAKPAGALPASGDWTANVKALPAGNADNGAKLFTSAGCNACHGLQKDQRLVGPSFYGLWIRAGTRVAGLGAREYLYQSIVKPNDFVVDTYQPNLMPQNFSVVLNAQQMADILAYVERDHAEK